MLPKLFDNRCHLILIPCNVCSFITKENLRYMLGEGFPEEEIDSIMKEAASDYRKGISYADFLSQWKDDKDTYLKEWQQHMVPDTVVHESKSPDERSESLDLVSEVSFDVYSTSSGDDGSQTFQAGKMLSERKRKTLQVSATVPKKSKA